MSLVAASEPITGEQRDVARLADDHEPIAIIGVGLRFPGGNDTLDGFARFLEEGRSGIRPVPEDRWEVAAFEPGADPDAKGKIRAAGCGFLDGIDRFDAPFFSISPLEAQYTDPQQRLLLEVTWEALEHASLNPAALRHGNGGVYIGASSIDYAMELDGLAYEELDGHLAAGITFFPMAGRLSYFLGWRGPSLSTDTACASSLTALHLAAEGLRRGECDIAIAGGVNAIHHPRVLVMFSHASMLAPDGRCKTFDESADGYVRAEGCGILVLKRLSDARRDGDNVVAVVRGTAIGQDGESAGLTVPNGTAQELVMRAALRNAGLTPQDIQYVEAHGTGTPLGDPIEMGAISDVFREFTKAEPLVVASLKTNVGHMEPAAGIGGIVKTILQMQAGTFFPHLNLTQPSGRIPWDNIAVTVPTRCLPWTAPTRRALINSFGFAGSIACAVIEEPGEAAVPVAEPADEGTGHVFTISAKSKRSLRLQIERYREFLANHPEAATGDVCYTANAGRSHFPMRLAGVVRDRDELAALLDKQLAQVEKDSPATGDIRKTAFLFTGQGSQYVGMGAALYRQFPVYREHVDECDRLFAPHLGRSIRAMMLGETPDAEEIHQTRYTQPALFALEYALAKLWLSWGVRPNVLIGHSIGEVAAAAVAGLFSLEDAVRLVATRARLMQSVTVPGGMVAVTAAVDSVRPLIEGYGDLAIAAVNSPEQCVVSGGTESLAKVTTLLEEHGLQVRQLAVSHAFHSPLMTEVFDEFRAVFADITFHEPALTIVSNLTGKVARLSEISDPEYWIRHIGEPVNFEAGMRTVDRRGRHVFVEIGPSRALTALARQCVTPADHRWLSCLDRSDPDGIVLLDAVAQMYRAGLPLSWAGFHAGRERRKIALPFYAFDRKRYWLPFKGRRHGLGGSAVAGPVHHPLLGAEVSTVEQRALGVREFSSRVKATNPAYLADHVIMGRVVFPGSGYLETMLALQDAVYGDLDRPIEQVRIREPLFLVAEEETELRTRLRPADDGTTVVEIVSRVSGKDPKDPKDGKDSKDGTIERSHIVATLGARPASGATLSEIGQALLARAEAAGEPDEVFDADAAYAAYAEAGLQYGPEFRRMRTVFRYGADLAVGDLRGGDIGVLEHVSPYLVDAATHAYAALADGESYLPVGYESLRVFKKPRADSLRVVLQTGRAGEVDVSIDMVVLEDGQPVVEMCGLGLKRVADSTGARRSLIHEPRWVKRSLGGQGTPEARHALVTHCRPEQRARLAELAADNQIPVSFAETPEDVAKILRREQVTELCWFWQPGPQPAQLDVASLRAQLESNYRNLLELLAVLSREGFGRNQRLWLVTEQAQLLPGDAAQLDHPPAAASLWGFGHSLLNEYPAYRTTMLDLPADADYQVLCHEWQARSAGDFQSAYRAGLRHVRRLFPVDAGGGPARDDNFLLAIKEYGQFANIRVVPAEDVLPQGDEIQVSVRAAGLNFKDVLNALGMLKDFGEQPLGFEAAGTVIATGPDATHRVGDEVVLNYLGLMKRRVTVPSAVAVPKPAHLSWTQAAGLPAVYVTAYYALHTLAGMKAGDKVLIHAAAGGVGQAAVQLAKAAGAQVFATASPHKWPLLRAQGVEHIMNSRTLDFAGEIEHITGGTGVDIVLNSLNKDFIPAGMRSLGTGGRFIEMGKVGAWTPEQVREVRPDVSYHNFDLSELPLEQVLPLNKEIMETVVGQVASGVLQPIRTTGYSLDEIEEAFSVLSRGANIGKLVLEFEPDQAPPARNVTVDSDHTYLITGGLGALGLVTANRLVDLGARYIALVSRGGTPPPDVTHLAQRLLERAEVTVYQGDVADPADVQRIVASLKDGRHPLGGIVHSAGSLADAPISAQTWESIDEVCRAKVYGTWLLHQATASFPELRFFVGYSSAAPVVGAPGQSNYAAANAFLDNLMVWRAGRGLPGLSINWGPWGEVGMSARLNQQLLKRWADEGIKLTTPAVGMRALFSLLGGSVPQAVVGGCDWDRFTSARPVANALYQRLIAQDRGAGDRGIDLDALLAAPKRERTTSIDQFVRGKVADVLHFDDADAVDSATEFVRLGLDSLVAVELKNVLEAAFGVPLPASVALDYPSAELLTEFLDSQLVPELAAAEAAG
jgi:acyl transferase domain-containing protein/NADPH:quinone reductase-like Zn-dependent oxidoreductase/acyl carrier protein